MSGPWEQYQSAPQDGPWAKYSPEPQGPVKQVKIGVEGLPQAVADVAGDFHPLTQAAVGAKALWDLAAMKLKQGAGFSLSPEEQTGIAANRALLGSSNPALAGAVATGVGGGALTAPFSSFAASRLAPALPSFLQPAVPAAVTGMVMNAATTPTLPGETNDKAVNEGAIAGALGDLAVRGGARVIQPITQSPAVQKLLNYDIVPTPGSAAGGVAKSIEDKLQSVPFVGDIIKNAQQRGRKELSEAAIKLSTPPGEKVSAVGADAIPEMKQAFSNAYDRVYGNSQIGVDKQLLQDLAAAKNAPVVPMSGDEVRKFNHVIQNQILDRLPNGSTLNTSDAKTVIEKNLGVAVREAPPNSPLQKALTAARDSFRSAMARAVGPNAGELSGINKAYSNFSDVKNAIEQADKSPGPLSGLPTPRQLLNAAKPGELNQLARAANQVMPTTIPNSGTTDRLLMSMLLGGAGAAASHENVPYLNAIGPAYWLALGASPALYSRAGSRYMMGDLIPGQPALADALRQVSPYAAQAGALYGNYR